jgi:SM-20-related protein
VCRDQGQRKEGNSVNSKPELSRDQDDSIFDFCKLRAATLNEHPFRFLIGHNTIRPEWEERLMTDFPRLEKGGSFPLSTVKVGNDFRGLVEQLASDEFQQFVEEKFSLGLRDQPKTFTVRGHCRLSDGKIHTDTESKIITVLLYMNPRWADKGGRLRILNKGTDINDFAAEVEPTIGTILIFKRCDHSFHGHLPFEGERKVIQMNWVTEQRFADREAKRHAWSAWIKRFLPLGH